MSEYVVGKEHIGYLVRCILSFPVFCWKRNGDYRIAVPDKNKGDDSCVTGEEIGQILWDENIFCVLGLYPNNESVMGKLKNGDYVFRKDFIPSAMKVNWVQVLKSVICLEHQSCLSRGWETSEAKSILSLLKEKTIPLLRGYSAAVWGSPPVSPY
jgi:hypothetical protein